jgi:hypothetical protein
MRPGQATAHSIAAQLATSARLSPTALLARRALCFAKLSEWTEQRLSEASLARNLRRSSRIEAAQALAPHHANASDTLLLLHGAVVCAALAELCLHSAGKRGGPHTSVLRKRS